jgi:hypothetical protein
MSIFTTILDKLGLHKPAAPAPAAPAPKPATPVTAAPPAPKPTVAATPTPQTLIKPDVPVPPAPSMPQPHVAPMEMVDVVSKLEKMSSGSPGLDWKVSIVDLMKLLGMDSSLTARKELATELGCPADMMGGDYSKMNVWLHKTVLQKIAENGGNIPKELLD